MQDTAVVKQGAKDILIVGLEDGTVGVTDLTATNGKNYKRPIFSMLNTYLNLFMSFCMQSNFHIAKIRLELYV